MPATPFTQLKARAGSLRVRDLVSELEARGWIEQSSKRGKGSHRVFAKPGRRPVTIPQHPQLGTVLSILKALEADEEEQP